MAISPLWPKPPRWPIQPGTVDPNQRWVWHTRPRSILPLWEHAGAGAAQRYIRLAQTRRTARTWQLNTGAAAMRTRYGPGVSIPTDNGAEIEALAGSDPNQVLQRRIGALLTRPVGRLPKKPIVSYANFHYQANRWTKAGRVTTLREKLVKTGARIVRHGRYVVFQLAEVAVPRALFAEILRRIERLRLRPPPFSA